MSFEGLAGPHLDRPCTRLRILRTALGSQGRAVSRRVLCSDLHFTEIPPAAVGGSAAVVLTFMSVWATLQGPCIVGPTLHTVSMRAGSCDNIWTKHEGGIWRRGKTESREGNETNNGFFKHLFYSRFKCMPSFNPVDGILLCPSRLVLQTVLQEACVWEKDRGCSEPTFFSLLGFGATQLPSSLKSIFRAVVSGRRKDLLLNTEQALWAGGHLSHCV